MPSLFKPRDGPCRASSCRAKRQTNPYLGLPRLSLKPTSPFLTVATFQAASAHCDDPRPSGPCLSRHATGTNLSACFPGQVTNRNASCRSYPTFETSRPIPTLNQPRATILAGPYLTKATVHPGPPHPVPDESDGGGGLADSTMVRSPLT